MSKTVDYLDKAIAIAKALEARGLTPVLVGGMALVILGSQRITNDFDFLISLQKTTVADIVEAFYEQGLELVSKLNKGEVTRTIDNKNVAIARLKLDAPSSAYFYDRKTQIKVDLLFDFPLPAMEVAQRANRFQIKSASIRIASTEDLLRLKEIAYADRKSASDAQDLEFLRRLLKRN